MHVHVHEPGHQVPALHVHDPRAGGDRDRGRGAEGLDAAIGDHDHRTGQHPTRVDVDDLGVAERMDGASHRRADGLPGGPRRGGWRGQDETRRGREQQPLEVCKGHGAVREFDLMGRFTAGMALRPRESIYNIPRNVSPARGRGRYRRTAASAAVAPPRGCRRSESCCRSFLARHSGHAAYSWGRGRGRSGRLPNGPGARCPR